MRLLCLAKYLAQPAILVGTRQQTGSKIRFMTDRKNNPAVWGYQEQVVVTRTFKVAFVMRLVTCIQRTVSFRIDTKLAEYL